MIEQDIVDAFSLKMSSTINDIKRMTPAQLDRVKMIGSAAENILTNRDFVLFVRQFQLETMDALVEITTHSEEDNSRRVALSNQLSGMDGFISVLKKAQYLKNRVVTEQKQAEQATEQPDT
jgi:diphthamide synthase subunit DPH2